MTNSPAVSIVMPVFNGERFVGQAVESIIAQTHRDFELVIVDDGSTDRTTEILNSFAQAHSRIIVHRQARNLGLRAALNEGCRLARGRFVARMDADDISRPERLTRQLSYLQANPDVGVLGTDVQLIDANGRRGAIKRFPTQPGLVVWSMVFFNSLAHPAVMMRRDLLEAAGFYPAGCRGGTEDYALFTRLARMTRLANLPEVLLFYRQWGGNMTTRAWEEQEQDAVRILRESLFDLFGFTLTPAEASSLRGLSRDQYPSIAPDLRHLAHLVQQLRRLYLQHYPLTSTDVEAINRDAAVKLWLLSALASRRSLRLGVTIAAAAIRISPPAFLHFAAKVGRRLASAGLSNTA